jgi:hypothetical protein
LSKSAVTVASRLSTKGTAVGVLVDSAVGGMGVSVSVGAARVGAGVSEERTAGGATVFVAAAGAGAFVMAEGALEGRVQAVDRKTRIRVAVRKFFISIFLVPLLFFPFHEFYFFNVTGREQG